MMPLLIASPAANDENEICEEKKKSREKKNLFTNLYFQHYWSFIHSQCVHHSIIRTICNAHTFLWRHITITHTHIEILNKLINHTSWRDPKSEYDLHFLFFFHTHKWCEREREWEQCAPLKMKSNQHWHKISKVIQMENKIFFFRLWLSSFINLGYFHSVWFMVVASVFVDKIKSVSWTRTGERRSRRLDNKMRQERKHELEHYLKCW